MARVKQIRKPSPAMIVAVVALVAALGGTAAANHGHFLKLGMFDKSSRDRLAGTGVIQYAAQSHNTGATAGTVKTFAVNCEKKKKATAGGFKWTGPAGPPPGQWDLHDAYPTGSGYVVRMFIGPGASNQALTVYANCVKSRKQRGTPPS